METGRMACTKQSLVRIAPPDPSDFSKHRLSIGCARFATLLSATRCYVVKFNKCVFGMKDDGRSRSLTLRLLVAADEGIAKAEIRAETNIWSTCSRPRNTLTMWYIYARLVPVHSLVVCLLATKGKTNGTYCT